MALKKFLWFKLLFLVFGSALCQSEEAVIYKQIDTLQLQIQIYRPAKVVADTLYPGIVFFHGGGWNGGTPEQFAPHAKHFSQKGFLCFLVEYRLKSKHGTSPFESLADAKSAVRYLRKNAANFQLDTARIIAAGGSAGGHLAAATALVEGFDDPNDDLSISTKPHALVLFNPVFDNGPGGYGYERIGDQYKDFSPLHNLKKGTPPTLLLFGTEDSLVPVETIKYYQLVMEKVGSRCDVVLYEGEKHAFFNANKPKNYQRTVLEAEWFLYDLGYFPQPPSNE